MVRSGRFDAGRFDEAPNGDRKDKTKVDKVVETASEHRHDWYRSRDDGLKVIVAVDKENGEVVSER